MKKMMIILPIIILLLIVFVGIVAAFNKPVANKGDILSFSYHYGSYFPGYFEYHITYEEGQYLLEIKGYNDHNVNVKKSISTTDVNRLASILNQYKIYEWDGFDKSEDGVMDGDGFNLNVVYEDGNTITAHGYMKYPNDYRRGHEQIVKFFETYY